MLTLLKNINLAIAFLLELCMIASLGYWGFTTGNGMILKIILGLGAPILAIILWGIFGAPRSNWQLQGLAYVAFKFIIFSVAIAALFATQQKQLSIVFIIVLVINHILLSIWHQ
ncbi:hypothetical protein KDA_03040 [Dictyobacter alpinus]|uniref:DUF2568 domain-containing protein n=1 Tax=Dictyobacter alpinus TaxID=2014873 RepID=A0A402B0E6_9CHLR|nr:YrdB family protein [Dictyobacter alpinus]GCE24820.1 hypothetical protein KDA_03040 [Dictyobacter alpinus]